jgi:hypothetical protein
LYELGVVWRWRLGWCLGELEYYAVNKIIEH